MEREQGTVAVWNVARGFGFVESDARPTSNGCGDIFIHYTDVPRSPDGRRALEEGQRISFVHTMTDRGARATVVVLLEDAA